MSMSRRGFLGTILATAAAPAIVKAQILMPVKKIILPNPGGIVLPEGWVKADGRTLYYPDFDICSMYAVPVKPIGIGRGNTPSVFILDEYPFYRKI